MKYLTHEKLLNDYNESLKFDKANDLLIEDFYLIANNVYKTFASDYSELKQACVNYAVGECFIKWKKFEPKKTKSIFAFYTSMISNDMKQHYRKLNRLNKCTISIDVFNSIEQER